MKERSNKKLSKTFFLVTAEKKMLVQLLLCFDHVASKEFKESVKPIAIGHLKSTGFMKAYT